MGFFLVLTDGVSAQDFSARVTVEVFFRICSAQMCGERTFTRATGESEYPRQEYNVTKHGEKFIGQQWATEGQTLFHS